MYYFISNASPPLCNKLYISVGLYPNFSQNLIVSRVSTTSRTTIFFYFSFDAPRKNKRCNILFGTNVRFSQLSSKGAILDIDIISGDLKQLNLKSDRILKYENSEFLPGN